MDAFKDRLSKSVCCYPKHYLIHLYDKLFTLPSRAAVAIQTFAFRSDWASCCTKQFVCEEGEKRGSKARFESWCIVSRRRQSRGLKQQGNWVVFVQYLLAVMYTLAV